MGDPLLNLRAVRQTPLHGSHATNADTSGVGGGRVVPPYSRHPPRTRKTTQTRFGYAALCLQVSHEGGRSHGSDLVGTSPTNGLESFNETVVNQSIESCVQSSRREVNSSEVLYVLGQGIAVLGTVSETR
jgi:hypothetical protein